MTKMIKMIYMKRIFVFFCAITLSTTVFAQIRGGEVTRKPNVESHMNQNRNRQTTPRKNTSSSSRKGISRNLDGAVLGKSSKQEVINLVNYKQLPYRIEESGTCLVATGEYTFGGVSWSSIEYRFHNDILWQVVYSKTGSGPSGSTIVFDYSNLKEGLLRKYKEYYSPIFADDLSFSDNITNIAVFGGKPEVNQKLQLRYTDAKILKRINPGNYNDL